ncbi:MAG: hypothetical protein BWY93_01111 [Euryarchaeota archaeon ADurb.BinA087]|nr:MAG: hypothetical protein BWY93_01111 [Euryarchaeota archaeon ADurb.BinA087]
MEEYTWLYIRHAEKTIRKKFNSTDGLTTDDWEYIHEICTVVDLNKKRFLYMKLKLYHFSPGSLYYLFDGWRPDLKYTKT